MDRVEARQLVEFASASRLRSLADGVESCLAQRGLASAWNDVIRPALRILEARYLTAGDCIDIEMVLIQAVSEAVDRHIHVVRPRVGDVPGPVLLVCSPGERHSLPLKVLHGDGRHDLRGRSWLAASIGSGHDTRVRRCANQQSVARRCDGTAHWPDLAVGK